MTLREEEYVEDVRNELEKMFSREDWGTAAAWFDDGHEATIEDYNKGLTVEQSANEWYKSLIS